MTDIIERYFAAFNAGDTNGMLACLTDDVAHHVNQGGVRIGKAAFAEFCAHMDHCYQEELTDLVILSETSGTRAAAEYIVNGSYMETDDGLPEADGQAYALPAGSFFHIRDGLISRVSTYYNLNEWIRQVS